jgi:hypothetical protein
MAANAMASCHASPLGRQLAHGVGKDLGAVP